MLALANCKAALTGLASSPADRQAQDLQQLIQLTETKLHQCMSPIASTNESSEDTPLPRVQPSVQPVLTQPGQYQHSPVVTPPPPVPRVTPAPTLPQRQAIARRTAAQQRRIRDATPPIFLPSNPPALST